MGSQVADRTLEERLQLHQPPQFTGLESPEPEAKLFYSSVGSESDEQNSHNYNGTQSHVKSIIHRGISHGMN